jgi:hypothetical protein
LQASSFDWIRETLEAGYRHAQQHRSWTSWTISQQWMWVGTNPSIPRVASRHIDIALYWYWTVKLTFGVNRFLWFLFIQTNEYKLWWFWWLNATFSHWKPCQVTTEDLSDQIDFLALEVGSSHQMVEIHRYTQICTAST